MASNAGRINILGREKVAFRNFSLKALLIVLAPTLLPRIRFIPFLTISLAELR